MSLGWKEGYRRLWEQNDSEWRADVLNQLSISELKKLFQKLFPTSMTHSNPARLADMEAVELRQIISTRLFPNTLLDDNAGLDYLRPSVRVAWRKKPKLSKSITKHIYFIHHLLMLDYPRSAILFSNPEDENIKQLMRCRSRRAVIRCHIDKNKLYLQRQAVNTAVKQYRARLLDNLNLRHSGAERREFFVPCEDLDAVDETCPACLDTATPQFMIHFDCGATREHGMCLLCTTKMRSKSQHGMHCPICRAHITRYFGNATALSLLVRL